MSSNETTRTNELGHHQRQRSAGAVIPTDSSLELPTKMNLDVPTKSTSVSFAKDETEHLTAYEKLLYESEHDVRFHAEEKAGRRIGFYRLRGNLGLGNFSYVKLGVHMLAKEKVAVKILDKTKLDTKTQRLLLREISSIERLHHPNIIRLYEVIETPTEYYIITEYAAGGNLYTHIANDGKMAENEAQHLFAQLTAAVEHMHSKGIIHRDIKCENVLFAKDRLIKLGDFGFSTQSEKDQLLNTFCGSPPYAAPELYRDENYVGIYVDLWAMGVLLYFLVTGLMPFRAENLGKLRKSVLNGFYSIPPHVSSECQELIRCLLAQEPTERWSIEQVRSCAWLRQQNFPEELESLPLNLTNFWTSTSKDPSSDDTADRPTTPQSPCEHQAHTKLEELGITTALLRKANQYSTDKLLYNRDSINGTYRILLHRFQKQSTALERDVQYERTISEQSSPSYHRSQSISGVSGARNNLEMKRRRASHDASGRRIEPTPGHATQLCAIL